MVAKINYKVVYRGGGKYVVIDADTGKLLSDENGHGYKSIPAAHKGWWYIQKFILNNTG